MHKLVDLSVRSCSTRVKLFFKTKRTKIREGAKPGGTKFKSSKNG
jgi:hypothetical protein